MARLIRHITSSSYRLAIAVLAMMLASACSELAAPRPRLNAEAKPLHDDCNPLLQDCGDPTYGGVVAPSGLQVGFDWNQCTTATTDADQDGVNDNCEWALAAAFAPLLKVDGGDCDWDAGLHRLGGEYYFAVQRNDELDPRIRIAYMPAYYKDCGAGGHLGDSEFILEDVSYQQNSAGGAWQLRNVFTSSHCGSVDPVLGVIGTDPNCQWWDPDEFHLNGDPYTGYPSIWVSRSKHSNYQSYGACNDSWWNNAGYPVDTCSGSPIDLRFPIVYAWQNIGSAKKPEPGLYVPPRWGSSMASPGTTESFWDYFAMFDGWNTRSSNMEGETSYGEILARYAHFWTPIITTNPCEQNVYYLTC